jgi:predicted transcriptional regulator
VKGMPKYSKLPFKTKIQKHENRLRTSFPKRLEKLGDLSYVVKREGKELFWSIDLTHLANNTTHFKVYKRNDTKISYELSDAILDIIDFDESQEEHELINALEIRSLRELGLERELSKSGISYKVVWETKFKGHVIEISFLFPTTKEGSRVAEEMYGFPNKDAFVSFLGWVKGRRKLSVKELVSKFNRDETNMFKLLSNLKAEGKIEGILTKQDIEINAVTISGELPSGWEENEVYIIGYCALKGETSFPVIAKDLMLDVDLVEQILLSNIYYNRIVASIGLKGEVPHIKLLEFPSFDLFHQITCVNVPAKEWYEITGRTAEELVNIPGITTNQVFLQFTKAVLGILFLRSEIMIKELQESIIPPVELTQNCSELNLLWRVLSVLTMSNTSDIAVQNEYLVTTNVTPRQPGTKFYLISGYEDLKLTTLLGLLSAHPTIKVSDIVQQMSNNEWKWTYKEILYILGHLTIDGILSGSLDRDGIFTCNMVWSFDEQEHGLTGNERLLLGMLLTKKRNSIKDISSVLQKSENETKQIFYSLLKLGQIQGEIASRGGDVLIEFLPPPPPLQQLYTLPQLDLEVLGYIQVKGKVKISEIENIWILSKEEIKLILFNATGSGLIELEITNSDVTFINSLIFRPPPPLDKEAHSTLIQLVEVLDEQDKSVQLSELIRQTNRDSSRVIRDLGFLVGRGHFPNAILSKDTFEIGGEFRVFTRSITCTNCGAGIEEYQVICPECNTEIETCMVCKGSFTTKADIVNCIKCQSTAHVSHLVAWLQIKNECPLCKVVFSATDLNQLQTMEGANQ